jgi:hypothetical protein
MLLNGPVKRLKGGKPNSGLPSSWLVTQPGELGITFRPRWKDKKKADVYCIQYFSIGMHGQPLNCAGGRLPTFAIQGNLSSAAYFSVCETIVDSLRAQWQWNRKCPWPIRKSLKAESECAAKMPVVRTHNFTQWWRLNTNYLPIGADVHMPRARVLPQ